MTPHQQLATQAWRDIRLPFQGETFRHAQSGHEFPACLFESEPEQQEFQIEQDTRISAVIGIHRNDLGNTKVGIGHSFVRVATAEVYRVVSVSRNSSGLIARFATTISAPGSP